MELNEDTVDIFKEDVNRFAEIDKQLEEYKKQLKPIQTKIKELKIRRRELEFELCSTLGHNNLKSIESPNNQIVIEYNVKKSVIPITQKVVKEKLICFFSLPDGPGADLSFNSKNPVEKGNITFDYIYGKENRDYKTKQELKVNPLN